MLLTMQNLFKQFSNNTYIISYYTLMFTITNLLNSAYNNISVKKINFKIRNTNEGHSSLLKPYFFTRFILYNVFLINIISSIKYMIH